MKTKDYAEKRKALRNQLNEIQLDILNSPSVDRWIKDATPVDKTSFVDRLGKVMSGAMELLWIAENNYIWEPEPGCDIHLAKGEAVRKIAEFDVYKPTLGVFDNPIVKCTLIEKAASVSALINLDDAQDRVWMRFNEMVGDNPKSNIYLSFDEKGLLDCFDMKKVDGQQWPTFIEFIKKHRQGKPIEMAGIALMLMLEGVLNEKETWPKWYGEFCKLCGVEMNETYKKDKTKIADGKSIKDLSDELTQTMFIKGGRGDALNRPHVCFDDSHKYY